VKARRRARNVALQALFEIDAVGHDPEITLAHRFEESPLPIELERFARSLVWGVLNNRQEIDDIIRAHAATWPVNEIAIIDRNVLRIGIYELLHQSDTPPRVAINEAVELSKRFGSESTRRFVNGVLGSALTAFEQSGILAKSKAKRPDTPPARSVESES
jgi:transcription antitermination protein NusB